MLCNYERLVYDLLDRPPAPLSSVVLQYTCGPTGPAAPSGTAPTGTAPKEARTTAPTGTGLYI